MIFQGDDCVCLHFTCAVAFIQVWMAVVLGLQELMCSVTMGQGRHVTEDHGQMVDFPFFQEAAVARFRLPGSLKFLMCYINTLERGHLESLKKYSKTTGILFHRKKLSGSRVSSALHTAPCCDCCWIFQSSPLGLIS